MSLEKTFDESDDAPLNIAKFLGHSDVLRLTSTNRMFKNFGHIDGLSLRRNTQKQLVKHSLAKERIALEQVGGVNPNDPTTPQLPTETQMRNRERVVGALGGMGTVFPRGEAEYTAFMGQPVGDVRGGDDQTDDD